MKILLAFLIVLIAFSRTLPSQGVKRIPPGIRQADKQPGPADIPPMTQAKSKRPDPTLMREQARELSAIAETIPAAVAEVNRGTLPKDMNDKLKRIEKLSKALRGEIAR
jgi:hypothetical protein